MSTAIVGSVCLFVGGLLVGIPFLVVNTLNGEYDKVKSYGKLDAVFFDQCREYYPLDIFETNWKALGEVKPLAHPYYSFTSCASIRTSNSEANLNGNPRVMVYAGCGLLSCGGLLFLIACVMLAFVYFKPKVK